MEFGGLGLSQAPWHGGCGLVHRKHFIQGFTIIDLAYPKIKPTKDSREQ